jgi:hypothetical protein
VRLQRRGAAPVAWGVNLMLAKTLPHLMEYYANTATANDTFFVSGIQLCTFFLSVCAQIFLILSLSFGCLVLSCLAENKQTDK